VNSGWITDTLILLPLGAAIFIAVAPLPRIAAGLLAFAVSLVEIAFWGGALTAFDYGAGKPSVQLQEKTTWFGDLGISYHVGFTGFAIWLVGMSAIVMTAAIGYAVWVGRTHALAYFASMLLLTSALVGGSITGIAGAVRGLGLETRRLQTGLVRTYVLMLAASLAVLAIVFLAVR